LALAMVLKGRSETPERGAKTSLDFSWKLPILGLPRPLCGLAMTVVFDME